jgi:hypothetical protein
MFPVKMLQLSSIQVVPIQTVQSPQPESAILNGHGPDISGKFDCGFLITVFQYVVDEYPVVSSKKQPAPVNQYATIYLDIALFIKFEMRLFGIAVIAEQTLICPKPDETLFVLYETGDSRCSVSRGDVLKQLVICLLSTDKQGTPQDNKKTADAFKHG